MKTTLSKNVFRDGLLYKAVPWLIKELFLNINSSIRHRLFHCLIEDTLTLLHVFQIDEIQYIVVLFAILILDGTEFPATFVFLDEIRIESDELADFLLRHRKRNTTLPADMLQYEEHVRGFHVAANEQSEFASLNKNHLFHDFFTLLVDVVLGSFRRASRTRDLL